MLFEKVTWILLVVFIVGLFILVGTVGASTILPDKVELFELDTGHTCIIYNGEFQDCYCPCETEDCEYVYENTPTPIATEPVPTPEPTEKVKCNSGRGNGSEGDPDCDPGNSGGHNEGGD